MPDEPMMEAEAEVPAASAPAIAVQQVPAIRRFPDSIKLEHQLVKVPYEILKKSIRAGSRSIEKEMNAVAAAVADVGKKEIPRENLVQHLNSCANRLRGLKRKLGDIYKHEETELQRSRARLEYLSFSQAGEDKEQELLWKKTKLDRILVDYLLRSSYVKTAAKLIEASSIQDLADLNLFLEAQQVIEALKNMDCSKALGWCAENKGKLKKAESNFEFKLRIQEFIELVRAEKTMDAIAYARKYLSQSAGTNMQELQEAMTTLILKRTTECIFYKALFEKSQWDNLIKVFKQEFYKIHGMPLESLLHIHFQAGLSALKTPSCYEEGCIREDPLSHEAFRKLADPLPFTKHIHSKLVCYITKEVMDEDNPPLVLPNGFVYGTKALEAMAKTNNGKITCPRTGNVFNLSDTTRAFVS